MSIDLGSAYGKIVIDPSGAQAGVAKAQAALTGMTGKVGSALGTLQKVGTAAFLGVGAAGVAGFGMALNAAIGMNAELETSTLQFETLMGSAEMAEEHVAGLFEFAKKTPFETGPIIDASLKLQTFGGAALNTMENLKLIGDASAATNAPINELGFWVGRLYSNLQAGAPFGEAAMRLQELAVMSPQARAEMERLQEAGASADEIFAFFQEDLGKFTGAMEKQAGTWKGLVSTIKDQLSMLAADALKPFFDLLKTGLGQLVELLNSPEVQAGIAVLATNLAIMAEKMIAFITGTVVPFVQEHGPAIIGVLKALAIAFGALMIISAVTTVLGLLLSPIGLVVAAVGLLAAAWINDWGGIQSKTEAVLNFLRPFIENTIGAIRTFIETTLAAIRAFWEEHGEGILSFTQNIWDAIKALIEGVLKNIALIGQAFGQLFRGDWEALGETLQEIWQNAWDTITEVLSNLWAAFRPILQSLWESIRNWWNGIDWAELGRNVIDGIINGLRSMAGALGGVLSDIVNGAVDAIKRMLGIASPSKVFAEIGGNIMAGLNQGMQANNTVADAFMSGIGRNYTIAQSQYYNQPINNFAPIYVQRERTFRNTIEEIYGLEA